MKTRLITLAMSLFLGGVSAAMAQTPPTGKSHAAYNGDVALTYHWIRTNTQPGDCGCFYLNGGGISGSWNFATRWSVVAEFSGEYAGSGPIAGSSLTRLSYLAGTRYRLPQPWKQGPHALQPFAQVLVGGGHANEGLAGEGDGSTAFVTRMGGGIDLPVSSGFAVRIIQADYELSTFANGSNDHQNNFLLGAGIVFRWSHL